MTEQRRRRTVKAVRSENEEGDVVEAVDEVTQTDITDPFTGETARVVEETRTTRVVDLPGEQSHSLEIDPVATQDGGLYRCAVTDDCGTTFTRAAALDVLCLADFNRDGGVDGADVESFFIDWEAGTADTNRDGGVDGMDVQTFFLAWQSGGC